MFLVAFGFCVAKHFTVAAFGAFSFCGTRLWRFGRGWWNSKSNWWRWLRKSAKFLTFFFLNHKGENATNGRKKIHKQDLATDLRIIVIRAHQERHNMFRMKIMLRPILSYLTKMYYFRFFFINLLKKILRTSITILVTNVWGWQTYLIYLSPKFLCKDSIDKMHEILILNVYFDAWIY